MTSRCVTELDDVLKPGTPVSCAGVRTHAAALFAVAALAGLLLRFPPDRYTFYPRCPIYTYLHLQCPGCGTTRALAALLHGDLPTALHSNALTTTLLPIVAIAVAYQIWRQRGQQSLRWPQIHNHAIYGMLVVATVFTIARNLTSWL